MVAVLVPPAVIDEVQAVLDLPMIAHQPQEFGRGDPVWVQAGNEVARVVRDKFAVGFANLAIDAQR